MQVPFAILLLYFNAKMNLMIRWRLIPGPPAFLRPPSAVTGPARLTRLRRILLRPSFWRMKQLMKGRVEVAGWKGEMAAVEDD